MPIQDLLAVLPAVAALVGALLAAASAEFAAPRRSLRAQQVLVGVTLALAAYVLAGGTVEGGLFAVDRLAAVVALLTAGISLAVQSFSVRYMDGDARGRSFFRDMGLMVAAILLMVVAADLVVLAVGWVGASLALASLIAHRRGWAAARASAGQTLRFLGIGDVALLAAVLVAVSSFATTDIDAVIAAATEPENATVAALLGVLLVIAAIAKSAQWPLAGWLADTMTAPTPVSALMHAGFVNAGGFLLARFADLLLAQPWLMATVFVIGATTALLGSLAMLVQSDVKRALAWSTVGQMGFMVMQCGLGAFAAAIYHLVAHGIFKATLFLGAGSAVQEARGLVNTPYARASGGGIAFAAAAVLGLGVIGLTLVLAGPAWLGGPGLLLASFALMAAIQALLVWRRHPRGVRLSVLPGVAAVVVGLAAYIAGTSAMAALLGTAVPVWPEAMPALYWAVPLLFALVLAASWAPLPRALEGPRDRLYVRLLLTGEGRSGAFDRFTHRLPTT